MHAQQIAHVNDCRPIVNMSEQTDKPTDGLEYTPVFPSTKEKMNGYAFTRHQQWKSGYKILINFDIQTMKEAKF